MSPITLGKNGLKGTGSAVGIGSTPTVDWGLLVLIGIIGLVFSVAFFGQKFLTIDSIGIIDGQTNVNNSRGIDSKKLDQALKILNTAEQPAGEPVVQQNVQ